MSTIGFYAISPYDARYLEKISTQELWVCTACFEVTSLGRNYQHCNCEPEPEIPKPGVDCANGFLLCALCARDVAGGLTRWSWLVCGFCKEVAIDRMVNGQSIPIGRHSFMNGHSWPVNVRNESEREGQAKEMLDFVSTQQELLAFGMQQAKVLFRNELLLAGEAHISMFQWRISFPASVEASKAALVAFRKHFRDKLKGLS